MRSLSWVLWAVVLLSGCFTKEYEQLPDRQCVVASTMYEPSRTGYSSGYTYGKNGGYTTSTVEIPASYGMTLSCRNGGTLTLAGRDAKRAFAVASEGDSVTAVVAREWWVYDNGERRDQGVVVQRIHREGW